MHKLREKENGMLKICSLIGEIFCVWNQVRSGEYGNDKQLKKLLNDFQILLSVPKEKYRKQHGEYVY